MPTRSLTSHAPRSRAVITRLDHRADIRPDVHGLDGPDAHHSDANKFANGTSDTRWLTINEACKVVGVDQSTLRRWSDAGKVPVFRTPGGHRRYCEDDLRAMLGEGPRRQTRPRVNRQILTDRSLSAYEDDYLRAARERRWFHIYPPATLDELRRLGRRLVDLSIRYVASAPVAGDRSIMLVEGRQIGEYYGRVSSHVGLTVAEALEAFIYFRFPVVRAVMGLVDDEGLPAKRAIRLYVEINQFMDEIQVAMVRAHEQT